MKPTFIKVYTGPGYPVDPKKEEIRQLDDSDYHWTCVWEPPTPEEFLQKFFGADVTPEQVMDAILKNNFCDLVKHQTRCALMMTDDFSGRLKAVEMKERRKL